MPTISKPLLMRKIETQTIMCFICKEFHEKRPMFQGIWRWHVTEKNTLCKNIVNFRNTGVEDISGFYHNLEPSPIIPNDQEDFLVEREFGRIVPSLSMVITAYFVCSKSLRRGGMQSSGSQYSTKQGPVPTDWILPTVSICSKRTSCSFYQYSLFVACTIRLWTNVAIPASRPASESMVPS